MRIMDLLRNRELVLQVVLSLGVMAVALLMRNAALGVLRRTDLHSARMTLRLTVQVRRVSFTVVGVGLAIIWASEIRTMALSITAEDLNTMANAVQAAQRSMLTLPMTMSAQVLSMINPIAGAVAGIVGDIAKGFVEFATEFWSKPDLPKSLFRRLPINKSCDWATASDIGRAALVIVEQGRGTGGASDDPPQADDDNGPNPLLIAGGAAAVGLAAWLYFRNR